jgi:L-galactose dehydrogenase
LEICKKYGVRLSDVAMRYAMDHPDITTTIVGMNHLSNIQQNVAAVDFKIPAGILDELATVIAPVKNLMWFEGQPENNIPRP